ncbi:MAG: GAF domain-containing sensor histidine kinase [Acidobacteriota bacterium]|nr:GAF domain-containing sensor histidine kinase [Acidobacteriota bacterium]
MKISEIAPELADAADVLSDQLRAHLQHMSVFLLPHTDTLDRRFLRKLERLRFGPRVRAALVALTAGAAARVLAKGLSPLKFIEQVEYNGRRLAKLNIPPSSIVEALQEYEKLLTPLFSKLPAAGFANFQWVREQLHFCVILTLNNAYYQVRESETQAFYELFRVELESRNLDELLGRFLQTLVGASRADAGQLYLLEDDRRSWLLKASVPAPRTRLNRGPLPAGIPSTRALVNSLERPRQIDPANGTARHLLDPAWKNKFKSCWSVPLAANGRVAGVMQFGFAKFYEWLPREQELLSGAAERCLMAAEKARLMEDLAASEERIRQLAEHMLHVEEMERRRISRELHDEAGQSLLCIRLQMELLEHSLPPDKVEWIGKLRETRDLTERTIIEIRRLIAALSPAVLEQLGLAAALRQLVNRFRRLHPIRVRLQLGRLARLPQGPEIIVYRLAQECFNNIAKHSGATAVNVSVASADEVVRLKVEDNGVGFDIEEAFARRDSFGLSGIRERVALLGGCFDIQSYPEPDLTVLGRKKLRGTKIAISFPLSKKPGRPDAAKAAPQAPGQGYSTSQRVAKAG